MNKSFLLKCAALIVIFVSGFKAKAITPVTVSRGDQEHIFTYSEIEYLEDPSGKLTIGEIAGTAYNDKFKPGKLRYPQNTRVSSAYWYRVKVRFNDDSDQRFVFEFFNHTIENLVVFLPDANGNYISHHCGAIYDFAKRAFRHKNFQFEIPDPGKGEYTYYFRLRSSPSANVIIVLRTFQRFVGYALTEYLCFGLFYGMILMFTFYNLLMYTVMRQRQYIYYILYLLSVALYEMSTDGIAFQYLWPHLPGWNKFAFGTSLFLISIFALLFAVDLLHVRTRAKGFYNLIKVVIGLRIVFYLLCLFYNKEWFHFRAIEFIPLSVAFITGIYIWAKGYKPARFFVLAYSFLFIGFILKLLVSIDYWRSMSGPIPHYSMSFGFILEMVFLSFAIGDKVRILKKKKEKAQHRIIKQMEENASLKDSMNRELEIKVEERTHEILKKTLEIREKSYIIEQQNEELVATNNLLQHQAEEIARMNSLLQQDNQELQTNIQKVTHDRVMSAEVNFEEFSKIYPDRETCFSLLADIKWKDGYACRKCGNIHYHSGHLPYSRRCTRCRYEESVIANTILQNTRIPVNKAFYMIFLIYSTKGKISSHKLSEITGIRQSTCWMYCTKIKRVMDERKKELRKAGSEGWSKLVLE